MIFNEKLDGKEYKIKIGFSVHAKKRMEERFIKESDVISLVKKALKYIIEHMEGNNEKKGVTFKFISSIKNFNSVVNSKWKEDVKNISKKLLDITVITTQLDWFGYKKRFLTKSGTKEYYI